MILTVIRNDPQVTSGHLGRVAREHGHEIIEVHLDRGESLPHPADVEAVAVLGGEMGAYDTDRFPYLEAEKVWLARLAEAGVPTLGICLGCQLLADALGGSAYLADRPEVAFAPLDIVVPDPTIDVLGRRPTLSMHRDTWDPPPGATVIARSARFDQAFRLGTMLGIQVHPEVDPDIISIWADDPAIVPFLAADGRTPAEVRSWIVGRADDIAATADMLFASWLHEAEAAAGR